MIREDVPVPAELEPAHAMWHAALMLLIEDARAHLAGRNDPRGEFRAAFEDLARLRADDAPPCALPGPGP